MKPAHAAHLTVVQRTTLGVLLRYKEVEQESLIQRVLDIGGKRRGRWRSKFTETNMARTIQELINGCLIQDRSIEVEATVGERGARAIFIKVGPNSREVNRVEYVKSAQCWRLTVDGWAVAKSMNLDRLYRQ